ncbi:hypothetical protein EV356DRAFT_575647 [Viridothelium virens]|uniref:Uncharacterized protein n=1 Tax=Viridothelium virens TaxID=1048519 RepID=A0A6A6HCF2_VIRVR|nr:hypothetical protein EV356DRAFT_575647 [Viridothelium virens]
MRHVDKAGCAGTQRQQPHPHPHLRREEGDPETDSPRSGNREKGRTMALSAIATAECADVLQMAYAAKGDITRCAQWTATMIPHPKHAFLQADVRIMVAPGHPVPWPSRSARLCLGKRSKSQHGHDGKGVGLNFGRLQAHEPDPPPCRPRVSPVSPPFINLHIPESLRRAGQTSQNRWLRGLDGQEYRFFRMESPRACTMHSFVRQV